MKKDLLNYPMAFGWKHTQRLPLEEIIWFSVVAIELLLMVRLILRLSSPHPIGFVNNVIYQVTDYLLLPFAPIFNTSLTTTPHIEWITVLALLGYGLLAMGLMWLVRLSRVSQARTRIEIARATSMRKYGY